MTINIDFDATSPDLLSSSSPVTIPFLDTALTLYVELEDGHSDVTPSQALSLDRFLALSPETKNGLTHAVAINCYETGLEHEMEEEAAPVTLKERAEVWQHVRFKSVSIPEHGHSKDHYVFLHADCDWDEDGLELIFKNGTLLRLGRQEGLLGSEEWFKWFVEE